MQMNSEYFSKKNNFFSCISFAFFFPLEISFVKIMNQTLKKLNTVSI